MPEIRLSIVEPYWKRGVRLREQLDNYLGWYAERADIEIVIVDDGSPPDPALPVIEEYQDKFACDLRLVQMPIKEDGLDNCVVFNRGVEEARGEWVMLTQTDHVSPERVEGLVRRHGRERTVRVGHTLAGFADLDGAEVPPPQRAYALSGLASPERFEVDLEGQVDEVVGRRRFGDHHAFGI